MPSIHETFGLVYIEALSQGLPVVFTKNQGVDGLFSSSIGESVNAFYIESIKTGLLKILQNPDEYSNKSIDYELFRWSKIAERYKSIYVEILGDSL
jgi:glycosyltransferase involved in cell wall biosynthesis